MIDFELYHPSLRRKLQGLLQRHERSVSVELQNALMGFGYDPVSVINRITAVQRGLPFQIVYYLDADTSEEKAILRVELVQPLLNTGLYVTLPEFKYHSYAPKD